MDGGEWKWSYPCCHSCHLSKSLTVNSSVEDTGHAKYALPMACFWLGWGFGLFFGFVLGLVFFGGGGGCFVFLGEEKYFPFFRNFLLFWVFFLPWALNLSNDWYMYIVSASISISISWVWSLGWQLSLLWLVCATGVRFGFHFCLTMKRWNYSLYI